MTITELVAELGVIQAARGNLPVRFRDSFGDIDNTLISTVANLRGGGSVLILEGTVRNRPTSGTILERYIDASPAIKR